MGFLSKVFGSASKSGAATPHTWSGIAESIATGIDNVIYRYGVQKLNNQTIVLDNNFNVIFTDVDVNRGGDVLAAVRVDQLSEFRVFETNFDHLRMICPELKQLLAMSHRSVDELALTVAREFEVQSPEFSELPSS